MSIIKEKRIEKELSRRQLAKRIGVTSDTINRWENRTHAPKLKDLPILYKELGITYTQMVNDYKEEK